MTIYAVISEFELHANPDAVKGMARFGIHAGKVYGVSLPILRKLSRMIGKDHELALQLWEHDSREGRILATMIETPDLAGEEQVEHWVQGFDSWEICDQCCMNLFERTVFAWRKAEEWSRADGEFVKRAGFVLMARLAVCDRYAPDECFEPFLGDIVRESHDNRLYVKKAVNWALRQIGKRNPDLNRKAVKIAEILKMSESKSARWIGCDAFRELNGTAVQQRIDRKATTENRNKR